MMCAKLTALAAALLLSTAAANADVSISNKPTENMDCVGGVCTATAQKAVLNVGELQAMLSSSDVTVEAGHIARSIRLEASLSWTAANRLTLDAKREITLSARVSVIGAGALTITCAEGGFLIMDSGQVKLWDISSNLTINGERYTLVRTLPDLSAAMAKKTGGNFAFADDYDAKSVGQRSSSWVYYFYGKFEGLGNRISNRNQEPRLHGTRRPLRKPG